MSKKMHDDEVNIDLTLVKELLSAQFPQWATLPIEPIQSIGTDNAIYRLGRDMCIRLPRIPGADKHIETEQRWLPKFAPILPLAIPVFLGKGNPHGNYPWHWSIYRWIEGENACTKTIIDQHQAAIDLAQFLIALQKIDPTGGPTSRRGIPLVTQDNEVRSAIKSLHGIIDTQAVTAKWEQCLQAPVWDKLPVWIHGDLLPANLLVQHGRLSGVIDFDSLGIGDPACDLIPAWSVFSSDVRDIFRTKLAVDDATWIRGCGWGLSIALIIIPYYQNSNLGLVSIAKQMIKEILNDSE
ncbi:MAG: aminoglycoside phosphotransferase family protein [Candidatus Babeliaceae bacterium]